MLRLWQCVAVAFLVCVSEPTTHAHPTQTQLTALRALSLCTFPKVPVSLAAAARRAHFHSPGCLGGHSHTAGQTASLTIEKLKTRFSTVLPQRQFTVPARQSARHSYCSIHVITWRREPLTAWTRQLSLIFKMHISRIIILNNIHTYGMTRIVVLVVRAPSARRCQDQVFMARNHP